MTPDAASKLSRLWICALCPLRWVRGRGRAAGWSSSHGFRSITERSEGSGRSPVGAPAPFPSASSFEGPLAAESSLTCLCGLSRTMLYFLRKVRTTAGLPSSPVSRCLFRLCPFLIGSHGNGRTPVRAGWPYRRLPVLCEKMRTRKRVERYHPLQDTTIEVGHGRLGLATGSVQRRIV